MGDLVSPSVNTGRRVFVFGDHTLDLVRGSLRVGDRTVELRPKSFAVLVYLIQNAGRLVSKDELIQAVWPDAAVSDDSLAKCVSEVRAALHDGDQRLVKTVPRRGYLFDVPVSPADGPPEPPAPVSAAAVDSGSVRHIRPRVPSPCG